MSGVRAVILAEDRQLECFIRRFLIRRGWERRQIRTVPVPHGRGSGEQWVRERFPIELRACRSRASRAATCLIVASDSDEMTVEDRLTSYRTVCREASIPFRDNDDRVAFIIPRRNIETWLAYLRGERVNETEKYRKYACESECRQDVLKLDEICRTQMLAPEPPPSLLTACDEFRRIADLISRTS